MGGGGEGFRSSPRKLKTDIQHGPLSSAPPPASSTDSQTSANVWAFCPRMYNLSVIFYFKNVVKIRTNDNNKQLQILFVIVINKYTCFY